MASIIFYGVGQNAKEKFKRWKEDGLEPVCFADAVVSAVLQTDLWCRQIPFQNSY